MSDDPSTKEFETEDGEVLPSREVMSIISTDPGEILLPPDDGQVPIHAYEEEEPRNPGHTMPIEQPPVA